MRGEWVCHKFENLRCHFFNTFFADVSILQEKCLRSRRRPKSRLAKHVWKKNLKKWSICNSRVLPFIFSSSTARTDQRFWNMLSTMSNYLFQLLIQCCQRLRSTSLENYKLCLSTHPIWRNSRWFEAPRHQLNIDRAFGQAFDHWKLEPS